MRTRKQYTNEELTSMLIAEVQRDGKGVWSDRRRTLEEMLRMRGVKLSTIKYE
ncbi:MAG: hypothetical protein IM618_14370 [Cytophagales bacterium]|nr:hypothetical protein [Cytophagales bacterium]